jgi:hypothetical protein
VSGKKIQVCEGWWRQQCGNVVRIVGKSGDEQHPWRCVSGDKYRKDGKYFSYKETLFDLVEYLGKNITITTVD